MRRTFVVAAVCLASCHRDAASTREPVVKVRCVAPSADALDEVLELPGRIEPPPGGNLPIASQVAGRIVEITVREGQRIVSGDIVASVDDVASRDAVRQAEASLAQSRAAEANTKATLDRVKALVARRNRRPTRARRRAGASRKREASRVVRDRNHRSRQENPRRVQVRATFSAS